MTGLVVLALVLGAILMAGAVAYKGRMTFGLAQGHVRIEKAFSAWRELFFNRTSFNKDMLRAHRDALTPGEYVYFEVLVKDAHDYYVNNPPWHLQHRPMWN